MNSILLRFAVAFRAVAVTGLFGMLLFLSTKAAYMTAPNKTKVVSSTVVASPARQRAVERVTYYSRVFVLAWG